jgi:predicted ATPase
MNMSNAKSAKIQEVHIKDFRGIEDLRLSFTGPDGKPSKLVVLGGPNGSGKTTVLEAVLLAAGNYDLVRGPLGKGAIHAGCLDYKITATFAKESGPYTVEYSAATSARPFKVDCDYFSSWRAPKLVGALGITAGKKGKRPLLTEENRIWNIKQYLINARAYQTMSAPEFPADGSRYREVMDRVNHVWEMFYPSSNQSFSVDPAGQDPSEGFDVFLNLSKNLKVPLDALSSGQLELFALAGSMLPDSYSVSMVFIDEPELHLDQQWHRLILRAMMTLRPDCQFIVGTHSPEIWDSVLSHQRHFLVPSDDPRAKAWLNRDAQEGIK